MAKLNFGATAEPPFAPLFFARVMPDTRTAM